jgi:hypothetical protein
MKPILPVPAHALLSSHFIFQIQDQDSRLPNERKPNMQFTILPILLLSLTALSAATSPFAGVRRSEENGPCTGKNGAPGVCVPTAKCSSAGGEYISNAVSLDCSRSSPTFRELRMVSLTSHMLEELEFSQHSHVHQLQKDLTNASQCPGTPNDNKCCIKTACGTGNKGNVRLLIPTWKVTATDI